jgi:hypothetical protein
MTHIRVALEMDVEALFDIRTSVLAKACHLASHAACTNGTPIPTAH